MGPAACCDIWMQLLSIMTSTPALVRMVLMCPILGVKDSSFKEKVLHVP
jgi:hypothetical protein